jgi:predicted small lipoprotein YifL
VHDDGNETDPLEEGERRRERVEVLRDDRAAGLDDGELGRVDAGVVAEVLLDLLAAALLAVVALVAELVIYLRIWGAKGPLGLPDEDE